MPNQEGSCLTFICCLPCILVLLAISLGVPSFLMFTGVTRMDACPVEPRIPIWMVVVASILFLQIILESVRPIRDRSMRSVDCTIDCCSFLSMILYFSRIALFATTIIGCFLVLWHVPAQHQCDSLLYWTAFVYCIASAICYTIMSIFWVCCCCCNACFGYQRVETRTEVRYT